MYMKEDPVIYCLPREFTSYFIKLKPKKVPAEKRIESQFKKIIGIEEEEDVPSWDKKAAVRPSKKGQQKTPQKEFPYDDDDIKLNWETLMHFRKASWPKEKRWPVTKREINDDGRDELYIGMSKIENKKVYFIVSSEFIPRTSDSYLFPTSFFRKMSYNVEYEIPQASKDELVAIVQVAIKDRIKSIKPIMVDGVKKFRCKTHGGKTNEVYDQQWIDENFKELELDFYDKVMDDKFVDKKYVPLPSGMRDNDSGEENDKNWIPHNLRSDVCVQYTFGDAAYCAFANMANALYILKDELPADFFFRNRFRNMTDLLERYTTLNTNFQTPNEFMCALRIAREKFGYTTRFLGSKHKPWHVDDLDLNVVKYVEIQGVSQVVSHVVCIYNQLIYDGTFQTCVKLSKKGLQFICNQKQFSTKCYSLEPSKKIQKKIAKAQKNKKRKHSLKSP